MAHVHALNILHLGVHECEACRDSFMKLNRKTARLQQMEEKFRQAQDCPLRLTNACGKCSTKYAFWLLKIRHEFKSFISSFHELILLKCSCALKKQTRARSINTLDNFSALICHSPLSQEQIKAAPPAHIVFYHRI